MLGEKLKELRESKGLLQRQIAAELELDSAYVCKMESNEKPVSRQHLKKLSNLFSISEEDLKILWLADKILKMVYEEDQKEEALKLVLKNLK